MADYFFVSKFDSAPARTDLAISDNLIGNNSVGGEYDNRPTYFGTTGVLAKAFYFRSNNVIYSTLASKTSGGQMYWCYNDAGPNNWGTISRASNNLYIPSSTTYTMPIKDGTTRAGITIFNSLSEATLALDDGNWDGPASDDIPITYYLTNCSTSSAPTSVAPGGTVSFPVTVSPGYNIFNPVQGGSISVYQGNDYIPFTFENGQLTFTAPGGG